ncbi:MAG: polysaccharide deacetylase family protein [Solirubrobacterales bacterium]
METAFHDRIPVLLYHSVSDEPAPEIADFAIGPDAFAEQIKLVAESRRTAVTLSELARRLESGDTDNLVCVTFDDGWRDNIAAAETLAAAGVPATIYVTSDYVGRPNMVDAGELAALAQAPGIEIGAHSVNHQHLDELPSAEAGAEIGDSKHAIEQLIGAPVTTFAYPHGAYDRRVRESVIEHGFKSAAAVKNALSHGDDDRYAIARWTITAGSTSSEVAELLAGRGAPLAWQSERIRTKGYRAVRRLRRRVAGRDG